MSAPEITLYSPSTALIALCQAQVRLLQQCLQLDRCEVYVTQRQGLNSASSSVMGGETFVPLVIYPQTEQAFVSMGGFISLPQEGNVIKRSDFHPLLLDAGEQTAIALQGGKKLATDLLRLDNRTFSAQEPLVLPLVYQKEMMGVLVTDRKTLPWQTQELQQLEAAAQSLAIACQLDRGQNWYASQFQQQQVRQQWERDRFDDLLHQLRNPLTALKTFSKLLLKRLGKEDKAQTIVEGIVREGEHLQELLQSFENQVITNVEAETAVWETEARREDLGQPTSSLLLPSQTLLLMSVTVQPILSQVLLAETAIAQEHQIYLHSELADLPPILGNINALREVFHNLISNALKYTPSDGQVWVRSGLVHPQQPQLWQGIEIADTGYGIPIEDQGHIFERHYRGVQAGGNIAGTGLGLAIAHELVEMMQGHLQLISPNHLSEDNRYPGTTFQLWLRLADQKD